jgi:hypothetical protein
VQGRDRGLDLELAQPVARQRRLQDRHAFRDHLGVPTRPVLLAQRDQGAVRRGPSGAPGMVQQHQGKQAGRLLMVGDRPHLAGQPDGLDG